MYNLYIGLLFGGLMALAVAMAETIIMAMGG